MLIHSAEHFLQFAVMGSVLASAVDNINNPKVYLLNIGSKKKLKVMNKSKKQRNYYQTLKLINYAGYIEGDAIYQGDADVVVCDGFVGNVALKTSRRCRYIY